MKKETDKSSVVKLLNELRKEALETNAKKPEHCINCLKLIKKMEQETIFKKPENIKNKEEAQ